MRYDLHFLNDYCSELGLQSQADEVSLMVDLGEGSILVFTNDQREGDSRIGFLDGSWHFHGATLTFADPRGHYVELDHLAILDGLAHGTVLICSRLVAGAIDDRWLVHAEFNDEFGLLNPTENLVIRRAECHHLPPTTKFYK